jgi:Flp pilus assembly pilin Flp
MGLSGCYDHLIPVSDDKTVRESDSLVPKGVPLIAIDLKPWIKDAGQDIAEYAVVLAVILVLVVGTIRLVGSNANNAFSSVASSLQ